MDLPETMDFPVQGDMGFDMPVMYSVEQNFSRRRVDDPRKELIDSLNKLGIGSTLSGKRIAIGAGSRMVTDLPLAIRTVADWLKSCGARPFLVPAMGSHGGASAEGQIALLKELGFTEETMGVPVLSSLEVVEIGKLPDGTPVYCDKYAAESDGLVVCQRIKPHTSISAPLESGICKGMAVGFGKHKGAKAFHAKGYDVLGSVLEETAKVFIGTGKVLFAVGIVENAYEETAVIEAIRPERIIEREKELLCIGKELMPQFLLDNIDVLIADRMGKDINGCGCDPNITGRPIAHVKPKNNLRLQNLVVLDITPASHGNACGIGVVDFIPRRLLNKINFIDTYTNVITSGATPAARLPIITDDDEQAIRLAMRCAYRPDIRQVRVVHIVDTLHMARIDVSENMLAELRHDERFTIIGRRGPLRFDGEHALIKEEE